MSDSTEINTKDRTMYDVSEWCFKMSCCRKRDRLTMVGVDGKIRVKLRKQCPQPRESANADVLEYISSSFTEGTEEA